MPQQACFEITMNQLDTYDNSSRQWWPMAGRLSATGSVHAGRHQILPSLDPQSGAKKPASASAEVRQYRARPPTK
jgi:hypothetical protein